MGVMIPIILSPNLYDRALAAGHDLTGFEKQKPVAAKAARLSPEQARKALAEWAARGGK